MGAFLLGIRALFGAIGSILSKIPFKVYLIAGIIALIALAFWYHEKTVKEFEKQVATLNATVELKDKNNKILQDTNADLRDANKKNLDAIAELKDQSDKMLQTQAALNATLQNVQKKSQNIETFIKSAPASQDGPIAPVLKETIRRIQNNKQGEEK